MAKRFTCVIFVLGLTVPLLAQVDQSSLSGTVTDASGALTPAVRVEAVSSTTGLRRQTLTGSTGGYQLPALPIGIYTVTFSKEGFRSSEFKNVELAVGQPRTLDARLAVGAVSEAVEVTAPLETLNRTSAEVGGLIEEKQIKEIPISGRNWASLMMLAPGAINYGDGSQRSIRFNGHSIDDANYTWTRSPSSASARRCTPRKVELPAARKSTSFRKPAATPITAARSTRSATTRWMPARPSMAPPSRPSRCISSGPISAARSKRTRRFSS
jgi:hypothetical protein